jgi:hypothetical protein
MAQANPNRTTSAKQSPQRKRRSERTNITHVERQPDLRALIRYDSLPEGHCTFLVEDDASAPHLRRGEYAVVDVGDRELQNGEVYVTQSSGGRRWRDIRQLTSSYCDIGRGGDTLVWWLGDLRGFYKTGEIAPGGVPIFGGLSDGPYETEGMQPKLLGRVIGYAIKPLGRLLEPALGYENEAAGNAAFDPAEYLDVLIAAGYRPIVFGGRYMEIMPERALSEAEDAAVLAVCWKRCAASSAIDRVKQECVRRGLVSE